MPQCLIPGCSNNGEHNLAIRCRRPDTSAIWAPNSEAFLCNQHADQGYRIEINLVPVAARSITTVISAGGIVETRTTAIIHRSVE